MKGHLWITALQDGLDGLSNKTKAEVQQLSPCDSISARPIRPPLPR
jgi:hypothetical protein